MANEPPIVVAPLARGLRKTRAGSDPFASEVGEALEANCGVYTLEGGFRQHGGIRQYSASAASGAIVWMKRWYKQDGTKYLLALSSAGTLYVVDDSTGVLTSIYTGLSGEPFSYAEINGWIYLANGVDPFLRFDGTTVYQVGCEIPVLGSMSTEQRVEPPVNEDGSVGTYKAATYRIKVTYEYGEEGILGESNAAEDYVELETVVTNNHTYYLTNLPVPSRGDVTFYNFYRTLEDETEEYFWFARVEATETEYKVLPDLLDDDVLTNENFLLEENHDIPPRLSHIAAFKGRVFGENPDVPGRVQFSDVLGSDVFPDDPTYYSDELGQDGEALVSLVKLGDALYGSKRSKLWVLSGDSNDTFIWDEVPVGTGFVSEQSIVKSDVGLFGLGQRDVQLFNGVNINYPSEIRGLLEDTSEQAKQAAIGVYRDKKFYLAIQPNTASRRTRLLIIHAEPFPGSENGLAASRIEFDYTVDDEVQKFEVASLVVFSNENDRIFLGGYDGYIYEFDVGENWARVGEGQIGAVFEWRSNWIWQPGGPANFKRWHKAYLMVESSGGELEVDYEIMRDHPDSNATGTTTIDLNPSVDDTDQRLARWNQSRWG